MGLGTKLHPADVLLPLKYTAHVPPNVKGKLVVPGLPVNFNCTLLSRATGRGISNTPTAYFILGPTPGNTIPVAVGVFPTF